MYEPIIIIKVKKFLYLSTKTLTFQLITNIRFFFFLLGLTARNVEPIFILQKIFLGYIRFTKVIL